MQKIDYKDVFKRLPGGFIIVKADAPRFTIVDTSKAYLKMTSTKLKDIKGQPLFGVFPDTTELAQKTGKGEVQLSMEKALSTKKPDVMGTIRYDIVDKNGQMGVRYWQVTHYPIIKDSVVDSILQVSNDMTAITLATDQAKLAELQRGDTLSAGLIGSWIWDVQSDVVIGDKGLANLFNVSEVEAKQGLSLQTFTEAIYKEDRSMVEQKINDVLTKGTKFDAEYRTIDRKGKIRWVIARGRVERDHSGTPISFPGIMIDITERKAAEKASIESEARLRFMADSMPQLVWITRPDGYHEYYNQRWYDYTGTQVGSTDGEGWNDLFHPDDQQRAWKHWRHSLRTGEPYEIEYRLYNAQAESYRWVIGRAMPFYGPNEKIEKWYGTCTDIDEQKRNSQRQLFIAEASAILTNNASLAKTFQAICHAATKHVADWCMIDMVDEAGELTEIGLSGKNGSYTASLKKGRKAFPVKYNDPCPVTEVIESGKPLLCQKMTADIVYQHFSNKERADALIDLEPISMLVVPIEIAGKVTATLTLMNLNRSQHLNNDDQIAAEDVSERITLSITNRRLYKHSQDELEAKRRLEKQLLFEHEKLESRVKERTEQLQLTNRGLRDEITKRHQAEMTLKDNAVDLERSNKELENFAYVASHDLQEPLRKIQAFGDLLATEYQETLGDGSDYLDRMRSAASRMSTLIQDLLSFSRVTTQAKLSQEVDLSVVVQDVLSDLETRIEDLDGDVIVDSLPTVKADPTHMRQLLQNLIGNALKFHKPNESPVVHVTSSKPEGSMVEIRVRDNGIGFDAKYLDRIFAVFQRLHGHDAYEGTGIGLAVCRKIVEGYDGTITAESIQNKGSTFIVRLPSK